MPNQRRTRGLTRGLSSRGLSSRKLSIAEGIKRLPCEDDDTAITVLNDYSLDSNSNHTSVSINSFRSFDSSISGISWRSTSFDNSKSMGFDNSFSNSGDSVSNSAYNSGRSTSFDASSLSSLNSSTTLGDGPAPRHRRRRLQRRLSFTPMDASLQSNNGAEDDGMIDLDVKAVTEEPARRATHTEKKDRRSSKAIEERYLDELVGPEEPDKVVEFVENRLDTFTRNVDFLRVSAESFAEVVAEPNLAKATETIEKATEQAAANIETRWSVFSRNIDFLQQEARNLVR